VVTRGYLDYASLDVPVGTSRRRQERSTVRPRSSGTDASDRRSCGV